LARADANLSACALAVKRYDRDRWFCGLFAPETRRDDLFGLYAFNVELGRVAEKVSEPLLGEIRLQWWREAIEGLYAGPVRRHEVVAALKTAIARHGLERGLFDRLIDARARDLIAAPPEDLDALEA
jgi:phytoene synthase